MITYNVAHHIPGRIRIEVPAIKKLSVVELKSLFAVLSMLPVPLGIKDIRPNLLTCSLVVEYDTKIINIMEYLKEMASNKDILNIIGRG